MQLLFDLVPPILPEVRERLLALFGPQRPLRRMDPLSQMIKSVVSSRTYDATSWATFLELPVVPTQRQQGHSKAFTIRNFCSVGHTFIEIFIRHVAHTMYPKYRAQIAHKPQAYMNDAFRQEASKTTAE